jgi:hypothetical protein
MKHLKTYENYQSSEIKKYVVVKYLNTSYDRIDYFIDTINSIEGNNVSYTITYQYNDMNNKIEFLEGGSSTSTNINSYLGEMLFTSDNLDECMKFLYEYIDTIKYNL